jgi:hypothetical protein
MAKLKSTTAAPVRPAVAEIEPELSSSPLPWWIAFSFLTLLAISVLWMPLARIGAHYEIAYNEGWNAYLQQTVADGGKIWAQPPVYTYANYPFVSFEIVGLLGKITHDVNMTGRWVSLLAYFTLALLTAMTVRRLSGSWRSAAYSALAVIIYVAAIKADRIGMNDPHLLGMAIVAFGFYAYVRDPESRMWLRISAVAFVLGLFTKQSLVAFPGAVAIQLWMTDRKKLVDWLVTGAATAAVLVALSFILGGPHFLEHLSMPRVYAYAEFMSNTLWYVLILQAAIVVALFWCFRRDDSRGAKLLVWGYVLAHAFAFFFAGGAGADLNHFFDPAVSIAIIGGVGLALAIRASAQVRAPRLFLTAALIVPFYLGTLTMLTSHLQEDAAARAAFPALEQDFAQSVQFVKSRPGPALCESLLLCYEAGKPEVYDAYVTDQLVKTGKVNEGAILNMLTGRQFSSIQLIAERADPIAPVARLRFSANFMAALLRNYRLAMRTNSYAIFVPAT